MQTPSYGTCHRMFWLKKERETGSIIRTVGSSPAPPSSQGALPTCSPCCWLQAAHTRTRHAAANAVWSPATHPGWLPLRSCLRTLSRVRPALLPGRCLWAPSSCCKNLLSASPSCSLGRVHSPSCCCWLSVLRQMCPGVWAARCSLGTETCERKWEGLAPGGRVSHAGLTIATKLLGARE